jgi:hypothetical protein
MPRPDPTPTGSSTPELTQAVPTRPDCARSLRSEPLGTGRGQGPAGGRGGRTGGGPRRTRPLPIPARPLTRALEPMLWIQVPERGCFGRRETSTCQTLSLGNSGQPEDASEVVAPARAGMTSTPPGASRPTTAAPQAPAGPVHHRHRVPVARRPAPAPALPVAPPRPRSGTARASDRQVDPAHPPPRRCNGNEIRPVPLGSPTAAPYASTPPRRCRLVSRLPARSRRRCARSPQCGTPASGRNSRRPGRRRWRRGRRESGRESRTSPIVGECRHHR